MRIVSRLNALFIAASCGSAQRLAVQKGGTHEILARDPDHTGPIARRGVYVLYNPQVGLYDDYVVQR